jgi:hypothetical protein
MLSVTERLMSNVATWILTRPYKFRAAKNKTLCHDAFSSQNLWHPFVESSLGNTNLFNGPHILHVKDNNILTVTLRDRPDWVRWLYFYPLDRHHSYPSNTEFWVIFYCNL